MEIYVKSLDWYIKIFFYDNVDDVKDELECLGEDYDNITHNYVYSNEKYRYTLPVI